MAEAESLNVAPSQQGTKTLDASTQAFQGAKNQAYISQQQQGTKGLSYAAGTQLQGSTNVGSATPYLQGPKTLSPANPYPQGSKNSGFATSQLHGTRNNGLAAPQQQGTKTIGSASTQLQDAKSLDLASPQLQRIKNVGPSTPQLQGTRSLPFPQGAKNYGYGAKHTQGSKNPNPIVSLPQAQGQISQEPDRTQSIASVALPDQEGKGYFSTSSVQMHSSKSYNFVASSAKSASSASSYSITQGSKGPVAAPMQEGSPAASVTADDTSLHYDDVTHTLDDAGLGHSMLQAQDRKSLGSAAVTPEQRGKTATSFNPRLDAVPMVPEIAGKSIWSAAMPAQVGKGLGSQHEDGKSMGSHVPGLQERKSQGAASPNTGGYLPTDQGNLSLVVCVCPRDFMSHFCDLYRPCAQGVCVMG